jgi:hypothetical protein
MEKLAVRLRYSGDRNGGWNVVTHIERVTHENTIKMEK